MVWTNGQYVAKGSVYGDLEEDGNGNSTARGSCPVSFPRA